jgi:protocatechuate 3,4-dioxygenase beta subunit
MDDSHPVPDIRGPDLHRCPSGTLPIFSHSSRKPPKTDIKQEFILLSDILGLSLLVDSIDHPKPASSTEGTVLGPFHTHDAISEPNGTQIAHDPNGEPCLVVCTVKDTEGKPVEGVKIDIWETDSDGKYDVQYEGREAPDQRAVMHSDAEGIFWFKAIVPVPYPVSFGRVLYSILPLTYFLQ